MKFFLNLSFICFLIIESLSTTSANENFYPIQNYLNHECIRPCNNQTSPRLCEYNFTVEWYSSMGTACGNCPFNKADCSNPECLSVNGVIRPIITVNRMLPGPAIVVCKGDEVLVHVKNNLRMFEAITIHWHGLRQKGTPYMDGTNMITQCPIISKTSFDYRFFANDYGTSFYHSHAGIQKMDGLFGPVVVHQYEKDNIYRKNYDYDLPEHVITLNDWVNQSAIATFTGFVHSTVYMSPHAILINGKGALNEFTDSSGKKFYTPRATFSVTKGKRYRFRLISAGSLTCPLEFSIDNHNLTVIASDGKLLQPFTVESIVIFSGERYDFILNANQNVENYWIRVKGFTDCAIYQVNELAILNYKVNETVDDTPPSVKNFNYFNMSRQGSQLNGYYEYNAKPNKTTLVDKLKAVILPDIYELYKKINTTQVKRFYLQLDLKWLQNKEFNHGFVLTLTTNNITLQTPSTPLLYKWSTIPEDMICNDTNNSLCSDPSAECSCIYKYDFNIGDVVEFVLLDSFNMVYIPFHHPLHLHGSSFAVLGMDTFDRFVTLDELKEMDQKGLLKRNWDRPPVKDSVILPSPGYTIIRFVADNPGTWMFHCHLDLHTELGMGFLIKIGPDRYLPKKPVGWPDCGNFQFKKP